MYTDIHTTIKKYNVIYADPPWSYPESGSKAKVHNRHYAMMSLCEICKLPVINLAKENAALFLWTTMPRLLDSLECMNYWGFKYKTVGFVWVKANKRCLDLAQFDPFMGAGSWTRSNAELCLLGFRGKMERKNRSVRQVVYSPLRNHSQKPDRIRTDIELLMGDVPRIELFAREHVHGWDCWGNEI